MRIFEKGLILIAYKIHKITSGMFSISLIMIALSIYLYNYVPIIVKYFFLFNLGTFSFSVAIRSAYTFLKRKFENGDEFYLDLLKKNKDDIG